MPISTGGGASNITGANITDGTIADADISSTAAINPTKLAERTALTLIPPPNGPVSGVAVVATMADAVTMRLAQIIIEQKITVNKISFRTGGAFATADTIDLSLYSEDGQTRLFSVTSASVTAAATVWETAVASVVLVPGNYWIAFNGNVTPSFSIAVWEEINVPFSTTAGLLGDVTSKPVLCGTLTITAGTPPATITPTGITKATNCALVIRLDN